MKARHVIQLTVTALAFVLSVLLIVLLIRNDYFGVPAVHADTISESAAETSSAEETSAPVRRDTDSGGPAEVYDRTKAHTEAETTAEAESTDEPETEPEPVRITIAAIGDMLMHPGVSGLAYQPDGRIDYSFIFEAIGEEIESADIAVVNNEVPFGGDEYGLQNYPNFNVYSLLGDAEAAAGFDLILNATNHVRDMGTEGVLRTIRFWDKYPEMTIAGIHETPEDRDTLRIVERNGIRIAVLNYVYGINAGYPYDTPYLVDTMRSEDRDRIAADLQRAEREADFTIVFPHWGEEYYLHQTGDQERWAQFFTANGADLIIGTHPHVLEPIRTVTADNGNTALCYYSLGNYISLQDETMAVLGGMAKVTLQADDSGVYIEDHDIQYLVTQYPADLRSAWVVKFEDYTEEMAARHGILLDNLPGNGLNAQYPFGISTFRRIIEEVQ